MRDEIRLERLFGLAMRRKPSGDRPVLFRNEGANLALSIDDEAHGDRLHAAGREPAADFRPEQRGDFIADEPVEDSPSLLRVHAIHVDAMRMLDRIERRFFRDLVQLDAMRVGKLEQLGKVPRDGLAFAVRVGR